MAGVGASSPSAPTPTLTPTSIASPLLGISLQDTSLGRHSPSDLPSLFHVVPTAPSLPNIPCQISTVMSAFGVLAVCHIWGKALGLHGLWSLTCELGTDVIFRESPKENERLHSLLQVIQPENDRDTPRQQDSPVPEEPEVVCVCVCT